MESWFASIHRFHQFQSLPATIHHNGRNMEHGSHFVGNQSGQHILPLDRCDQHHPGRTHFYIIRLQTENQTTHPKIVSRQNSDLSHLRTKIDK